MKQNEILRMHGTGDGVPDFAMAERLGPVPVFFGGKNAEILYHFSWIMHESLKENWIDFVRTNKASGGF